VSSNEYYVDILPVTEDRTVCDIFTYKQKIYRLVMAHKI